MILEVGVKVFLKNDKNKFLLLKRSSKKYDFMKSSWDLVGGRINPGTKLAENLTREIQEETKLSLLSEPQLLYAQDIIYNPGSSPDSMRHVVRLTYTAETKGDPVLDTSENTEYKWLSLDEMKKQEDLDVYVKEIIDKGIIK